MKEVIVAKSAGFCFGVQRAVDTVYNQCGGKNVFTYGPIIHNEEVVKDLHRASTLHSWNNRHHDQNMKALSLCPTSH